ncbi:MAG TPA: hypothetical protein VFK61_08220 [Candidatus Limnocylindria bacterium]|nr:hypothetical protein [Candidatus Limnocylindria bacterium]
MPGLPETLTISALLAATLEYAILLRHREDQRRAERFNDFAERLGHQALQRMRLLDRGRPARHWASFGTRFR